MPPLESTDTGSSFKNHSGALVALLKLKPDTTSLRSAEDAVTSLVGNHLSHVIKFLLFFFF